MGGGVNNEKKDCHILAIDVYQVLEKRSSAVPNKTEPIVGGF